MCSPTQDELFSREPREKSFFEALLEDTFKNGKKLIEHILSTHIVTHPLAINFLTKEYLKYCNKNFDESTVMERKPTKDEIRITNIAVLAGNSKLNLRILEEKIDFTDENSLEVINTAIDYGRLIFITELLSSPNIDNVLQRLVASEHGRISVNRCRWEHWKKPIDSLVAEAVSKWKDGSLLLHNDMADDLLRKNDHVNDRKMRNALIKALRPSAKKYGRLRGEKGICKNDPRE